MWIVCDAASVEASKVGRDPKLPIPAFASATGAEAAQASRRRHQAGSCGQDGGCPLP